MEQITASYPPLAWEELPKNGFRAGGYRVWLHNGTTWKYSYEDAYDFWVRDKATMEEAKAACEEHRYRELQAACEVHRCNRLKESLYNELMEMLQEFATQHKCGCHHPACSNCERDTQAAVLINKVKENTK